MTNVEQTNRLTNEQLQNLLNIEHIRQHLFKVGLINQYGDAISKEDYERIHERRSRRRHRLNNNIENRRNYQTSVHHPLPTKQAVENNCKQSKSSDYSINRRLKSASTSQSKQKNKSQSPPRLSSPHQSTRTKSVLMRRTVSPKIIPNTNRCIVTMIYYGSQMSIDYERNLFEPDGDEILVMQQHCGGENLIVYKGALKPNEKFQVESRRHPDYPFALAFYVNGLIDNRLSICCESRYKHNVRIGGKRGLFGIIDVQKSKACKRCRYEKRMKRLAASKAKQELLLIQISTPEPNLTRTGTPELIISRSISPTEQYQSQSYSLIESNKPTFSITNSSINFDGPEEKFSTPHGNSTSNYNHQHRNGKDTTIIDQSNPNSKNVSTEINRKENTVD